MFFFILFFAVFAVFPLLLQFTNVQEIQHILKGKRNAG